ncbi:hypothetical protein J6590_085055 [Homalodisca vitripennis]|nr:hypothetical protein J6590_085055 [Homalodisca vitripennis]
MRNNLKHCVETPEGKEAYLKLSSTNLQRRVYCIPRVQRHVLSEKTIYEIALKFRQKGRRMDKRHDFKKALNRFFRPCQPDIVAQGNDCNLLLNITTINNVGGGAMKPCSWCAVAGRGRARPNLFFGARQAEYGPTCSLVNNEYDRL